MKLQVRFAVAVAVLALVAALSGIGGAYAGTVLIGSKQIRNGSLLTQDYKTGSVRTSDVQNGTVSTPDLENGGIDSVDIGTNEVTPSDLELPDPKQVVEPESSPSQVGGDFVNVDPVTTYTKVDPTSVLEVTWTGSASAGFSPCQFQLRVDGQPAAPGAGVIYVSNGSIQGNVSLTASFEGLAEGPHEVAIFARTTGGGGSPQPCTVSPPEAQIMQTFLIGEQVT